MQKVPMIDAIETAQSANDSMPEMDAPTTGRSQCDAAD